MPERRSNLPARRTSLIGRERDLAALGRLVRDGQGRLVTLAGAGGAGKTALALELARDLATEMPDGAWLVDLSGYREGDNLWLAACSALRLVDRTCSPEDLLAEWLEPRQMLLVLDNCEQLAGPVGELVDALLDRCPDLHVLATSRVPLHVRGESVYVLPALRLPEERGSRGRGRGRFSPGSLQSATGSPALPADAPTLADIAAVPAIQLFVERARAARPDFDLTPEIAPIVVSICRRLDGLPLAIEFAAAEMAALTPAEIKTKLEQHESVRHATRVGPRRQRTMEATLDWSHDLLTPDQQILFRRLAVFSGDWTLEAAEAVCAAPGSELQPIAVSASLVTLVEHCLVLREERAAGRDGTAGRTRFRFLKTVGEYARQKLIDSGEAAIVALAHARYFAALVARRDLAQLHCGPSDLDRIAADHENCSSALRRTIRMGALPLAALLTASLVEYWRVRGYLRVGIGNLEALLERLPPAPSRERAFTLLALADYAQVLGDADAAEARANAGVEMCQAIDDYQALRAAYGILGDVAGSRGDYDAARGWYARARTLLGADNEPLALGFWHANVGGFSLAEGRDDEARSMLEQALACFDQAGPIWYRGKVLVQLAALARRRGEFEPARQLLAEALDWFRRYDARTEAVDCLDEFGRLALDTGDPARAISLFAASSALRDSMGMPGLDSATWPAAEIEQARERLAPEAFGLAWSVGRSLSIEEIDPVEADAGGPGAGSRSAGADEPDDADLGVRHEASDAGTGERRKSPRASEIAVSTGSALTRRELEVAELVALGLTNAEIGGRLGISPGTARVHIERILSKLGLTSRVQIATWIVRNAGAELARSSRS